MLTLVQDILILCFALAFSLLFMRGLNRIWPVAARYATNDQIGWQLSVLGTTYAVILGFMLYTEWTNFSGADLNVDLEASALRNVFRLAEGLPQPQRAQLESQSREYVAAVLEKDWPGMLAGGVPEDSHRINQVMWRTLMSVKSASSSEYVAEDHALSELSELTRHRRTRLLQSESRLPGILWTVLLVGGALTVVSVSMFGSVNQRLHTIQVSSLTLLVTLVMLAIADLDRPFQGWVHVSDYAFERASENLREQ